MRSQQEIELAALLERWETCGGVLITFNADASVDNVLVAGSSDSVERRANFLSTEYLLRAMEPVCRICGCSELDACEGGCAWALPDVCTRCYEQMLPGPGRHG